MLKAQTKRKNRKPKRPETTEKLHEEQKHRWSLIRNYSSPAYNSTAQRIDKLHERKNFLTGKSQFGVYPARCTIIRLVDVWIRIRSQNNDIKKLSIPGHKLLRYDKLQLKIRALFPAVSVKVSWQMSFQFIQSSDKYRTKYEQQKTSTMAPVFRNPWTDLP